MTSVHHRSSWVLLLALAAACGAHSNAPPAATLEVLRRRAGDGAGLVAQRDRALAELVAPGGDPAEGARQLGRLRDRLPDDPRVRFGLALVELTHGAFAAGAGDLARAI